MFRKYHKIHRLGKEETDGVLLGTCYIQEKLDGANTSIWLDEGILKCGSRNRELGDEDFNGFVQYVKDTPQFMNYLSDNPNHILYGEWLVRHTICYKETAYRKFYLFDIWDGEKFIKPQEIKEISDKYNIISVPLINILDNPSLEYLESLVGQTEFGEKGEGIVIKNMDFINTFGDLVYAKLVSEKFKEDNGIIFGGNNRHSETYWEMYVVNKYITLPRVKKIMEKIQPTLDERLDLKHTPRIAGTVYHDMLQEEIWEISKKVVSLNFNVLKRIASKKAIQIYKDILSNNISVADKND